MLYAVGYRNRYHFPHHAVVRRYAAINALSFATDRHGAIQFKFQPDGQTEISVYRDQHQRYWHERTLGIMKS